MKIKMPVFQPFDKLRFDFEGFPENVYIDHPCLDGLIDILVGTKGMTLRQALKEVGYFE